MSRTFNGNCNKNARIKIDYSGVKPKVNFSYPSKIYGVSGSMFTWIFMFWFLINIPLFFYLNYFNVDSQDSDNYLNVQLNSSNYNLSNFEDFQKYVNDTDIIKKVFIRINEKDELGFKGLWEDLRQPLRVIAYLFLIPWLLIYYPFKKYWEKVYPKFQGFMAKKKIRTFIPADIKHSEENGYYCEVPLFSNIVLNYEATKEFSKYLNFVEIEEYKFKYYYEKGLFRKKNPTLKERKRRLKRKKRRELNEWLWYARFYFKDKPKSGTLEVIFK